MTVGVIDEEGEDLASDGIVSTEGGGRLGRRGIKRAGVISVVVIVVVVGFGCN